MIWIEVLALMHFSPVCISTLSLSILYLLLKSKSVKRYTESIRRGL